jgi:hypothetical protein
MTIDWDFGSRFIAASDGSHGSPARGDDPNYRTAALPRA